VFSFAQPLMWDSAADPAVSGAVSISLSQVGETLSLTVAPDPTWLADPPRPLNCYP